MRFGCVLMAAGTASRFGENKLLHPIEGRSLLSRATAAAPACLFACPVAVVSTEATAEIARAAGYQAVFNPDPARGQGTTIVLGMQAMVDVDAVLFCVADQPYLTEASVRRILDAFVPGRICALSSAGKRGNPILFPKECFDDLLALAPEETGRVVLRKHAQRLHLVEAGSARELFDVDTKADLASL